MGNCKFKWFYLVDYVTIRFTEYFNLFLLQPNFVLSKYFRFPWKIIWLIET